MTAFSHSIYPPLAPGFLILTVVLAMHFGVLARLKKLDVARGVRSDVVVMNLRVISIKAAAPIEANSPVELGARSAAKAVSYLSRSGNSPARLSSAQLGLSDIEGEAIVLDPLDRFVAAGKIDAPPVPVSAPDIGMLTGVPSSGLKLRLRLYIDELGAVVKVQPREALSQDAEMIKRVAQMFYATRFMPGRLADQDVASYVDVEMQVPTSF